MKLIVNQEAPDFTIADISGNPVTLSAFKGQKVHLNFYRFSGCPFCNLRFHEIEKLAPFYKDHNIKLISVYESSPENMRAQIADEKFYATMIPDAKSSLYELYDLDRSKPGFFNFLLFKGGLSKVMRGQKLFRQKVQTDGHFDRIEAEFFIGSDGKIVYAYYGKRPGDNVPVEVIKKFIVS